MRPSPNLARARGLTLIELLVSLAIGLVLMVAIVSAYLGSAGASRMAEAQGRMNEDAQAALDMLAQQLRQAGANPKQPSYANDTPRNPVFAPATGGQWTNFAVRGCDNTFSNIDTAADPAALTCSGTGPHSISIRYEADQFNTVRNGTSPTDCLGNALTAVTHPATASPPVKKWTGSAVAAEDVSYFVAENRYYVATATGVGPSLFCMGNGGSATAQPLVENVEDLQITYGVLKDEDPATTPPAVGGYLTAAQVDALTPTKIAANTAAGKWSMVQTARICVIVRSAQPVLPDADSGQYFDCSGTKVTSQTDLRLRKAYITTVVLRNRVGI